MQIICCVCNKTKDHNGWKKQAAWPGMQLSHGYCPQCYQQMMKKLENFFSMPDYRKTA